MGGQERETTSIHHRRERVALWHAHAIKWGVNGGTDICIAPHLMGGQERETTSIHHRRERVALWYAHAIKWGVNGGQTYV